MRSTHFTSVFVCLILNVGSWLVTGFCEKEGAAEKEEMTLSILSQASGATYKVYYNNAAIEIISEWDLE